jgi:hypothetical protein
MLAWLWFKNTENKKTGIKALFNTSGAFFILLFEEVAPCAGGGITKTSLTVAVLLLYFTKRIYFANMPRLKLCPDEEPR